MITPELINFIKEARKRGFDDSQIKEPLIKNGWPVKEINQAFLTLKRTKKTDTDHKIKNQVTIYLGQEVLTALEKRAKKNLFNLNEQIEDILRRSTITSKKQKVEEDKVDDLFLKLFSRKNCGRPKKQ
ncbi:MAG: hypothetical protein Q8L27_00350 [archaeon]|nr:hypothetical protein [archaeon]